MILVDSSVWIDHFNKAMPDMEALLKERKLLMRPFVKGEILVGSLRQRASILIFLESIEQVLAVDNAIVLVQLETWHAYNRGIGWIDLHLLSAAHASGALLWTRDKRLGRLAEELGLRFIEP